MLFSAKCSRCGEKLPVEQLIEGPDDSILCLSCFENYERCELCGEYCTDVIQGSNEGGYSLEICGDCREFNPHVYRCTECGDYFFDPLDDMHNVCWKCSPHEEDDE